MDWVEPRLAEVLALLLASTSTDAIIDILCTRLGLIPLRAVMVARLLRFCDQRFVGVDMRVVGSGAEDVLAAIVGKGGTLEDLAGCVVPLLRAGDAGKIVAALEAMKLEPLSLTNLQHFCCELRKILSGTDHDFNARAGYKELWEHVVSLEMRLQKHGSLFKRRRIQTRDTI